MKKTSIAIVGATGLVGSSLLKILEERKFPIARLHLLASRHSVGKGINFADKSYLVENLEDFDFSKTQLCFFCVGNDLAERFIPKAVKLGNTVVDKSFFYRNHKDVPLIVPEVNIQQIADFTKMNIISNPNCNTIPIAVALKPIHEAVGIARINVATYQSVSGTGKDAVAELLMQARQVTSNEPVTGEVYPQQIAFNVLPHIDEFQDNGYTLEEMKIVWEMKKIFSDDSLSINPTAVRVPVICGHAAAIHLETKEKMTVEHALSLLSAAPGVELVTGAFPYPTPAKDAAGKDPVFVGRVRKDISHEHGLSLWVVADNLRKGAALNAVQIAEHLIKEQMLS